MFDRKAWAKKYKAEHRAEINKASAAWNRKNSGKKRAADIKYRKTHPEVRKKNDLQKNYGLTMEAYQQMLNSTGGTCFICHQLFKFEHREPHVDHDHNTGKVRGLLCKKCNTSLGGFNDSIDVLLDAIEYLRN
jgi:hypothetical protein